jgi:hypothetical protein
MVGPVPREQLVEHYADAVDFAQVSYCLALYLLRGLAYSIVIMRVVVAVIMIVLVSSSGLSSFGAPSGVTSMLDGLELSGFGARIRPLRKWSKKVEAVR